MDWLNNKTYRWYNTKHNNNYPLKYVNNSDEETDTVTS